MAATITWRPKEIQVGAKIVNFRRLTFNPIQMRLRPKIKSFPSTAGEAMKPFANEFVAKGLQAPLPGFSTVVDPS